MSFAKIAVLGNLGQDPETRYTPSGSMLVALSIAVNSRKGRQGSEDTPVWYRISAWDKLADRLDKLTTQGHLAKGGQLYVEGQFEPREYTANDGRPRISYDITLTDFQFVESGERSAAIQPAQSEMDDVPF